MTEDELYADAIFSAISVVSSALPKSNLTKALSALVAVQANLIGGIEDPELREKLMGQSARMLSQQVETQRADGVTATVLMTAAEKGAIR